MMVLSAPQNFEKIEKSQGYCLQGDLRKRNIKKEKRCLTDYGHLHAAKGGIAAARGS